MFVLRARLNVCLWSQDSELQYEVEVAGPPLCMAVYGTGGGEGGSDVLYGTQTGRMGLVRLSSQEPDYCWDMLNERRSEVTTLTSRVCMMGCGLQVWGCGLHLNL